jgi:hypothetical protein
MSTSGQIRVTWWFTQYSALGQPACVEGAEESRNCDITTTQLGANVGADAFLCFVAKSTSRVAASLVEAAAGRWR